MRLRRLQVERFRGIRSLDWTVASRFACLVGPGDSCKTSILDALELVLSPRWNVPFDDFDFFDGDTSNPLVITATVGEVPAELRDDGKFGLHLMGWLDSKLVPEPVDDCEPVLVIELRVAADLEPVWNVIDGRGVATRISSRDREALAVARLGVLLDRHLAWTRGSVLSRLTGDYHELSSVVADATRTARETIASAPIPKLDAAASTAQELARDIGVAFRSRIVPRVDSASIAFSLHDGKVPLRRAGTGTRRLLTSAIQRGVSGARGALIVDEFEHGLEPHRIRWALRLLQQDANKPGVGQVLVTSHSPIVIGAVDPAEIGIARRDTSGGISVLSVPDDLRSLIHRLPDAVLARKLIVCEGETEVGFARSIDALWHSESGESLAFRGVAVLDGGGVPFACDRALKFRDLGYEVALFVDSDRPLSHPARYFETKGIVVVQWSDAMSIEERISADLPWTGVVDVARAAINNFGPERVLAAVAGELGCPVKSLPEDPDAWLSEGRTEGDVRRAFGRAAKSKTQGWFKRDYHGEELGSCIAQHLSAIPNTDLARKLTMLRRYVHG